MADVAALLEHCCNARIGPRMRNPRLRKDWTWSMAPNPARSTTPTRRNRSRRSGGSRG